MVDYSVVAFIFALVSPSVGAEEGELNFYVTPEFPESQVEGKLNYFDIQGQPGSTHPFA